MVVVVKIGGSSVEDALTGSALDDLQTIARSDRLVVVHGGGDEVTAIAEKLGVEQRFVVSPDGFRSRYTDERTIEIFSMVMAGKVNKKIVRDFQTHKIPAVGISGLDGGLIRAERKKKLVEVDGRGRKRVIEGGYTGRVTQVNLEVLDVLMKGNFVPVIAPLALGEEHEALNIDGDRAAAHVAGALKADALILVTDVEGLMMDEKLVPEITASTAKTSLNKIGPGMITKVYAAVEALELGARQVIISRGYGERPFTSALKHETGTLIKLE